MAKRTDEAKTVPTAGDPTTTARTSDGSQELVPQFFSSDTGEGVPVIDPSPPFLYAHHRRRWMVLLGQVVPDLSKIPLVSGCNRVMKAEDGRYRFADTQAMFQDRHFKIIQPQKAPNGRTYLRTVDTMVNRTVRKAVISCFETAHAGEARTEWDYKAFVEWLLSLVADGTIAPITPHRASEMLAASKTALAKAEHRLENHKASSPQRAEALRVEVKALEAAAKARGAVVPAQELELGGAA